MSQVVTGEAVAVDLRVARFGSRMSAALIDLVLQVAILIVSILVVSQVDLDPAIAFTVISLILLGALLGYPVAFETLWSGRTPGKAAMGLRVVRDDGGPIRFRHALVRGLLGVFVERPPSPLSFVGVIAMLAGERGKRLGDIAAGVLVLQERVPARAPTLIGMPPPLAEWATGLDLSRLPDDLALAVREFLGRAASLRPGAREQLGQQLHAAVSAVVTPPPPGTPGWAYLAAVLAERRRREEERMRGSAAAVSSWDGRDDEVGDPAPHVVPDVASPPGPFAPPA